jgi:hypothetical protein
MCHSPGRGVDEITPMRNAIGEARCGGGSPGPLYDLNAIVSGKREFCKLLQAFKNLFR